jgi:Domain of unknown function (DUF4157)
VTPDSAHEQARRRAAETRRDESSSGRERRSEPPILRLQHEAGNHATADLLAAAHAVESGGRPLAPGLRTEMEAKLGADLSAVRVHTEEDAAVSAAALDASAYTLGDHVAFAAAAYDPTSTEGKHLLAHELAHVVQQLGTKTRDASPAALEKEAETAVDGGSVTAGAAPAGAIQLAQKKPPAQEPTALRKLLKDPEVWERVVDAAANKRDVRGAASEELFEAEVPTALKTPADAKKLLPAGTDPAAVEFVPGREIWDVGGRPYSDGLVVNKDQLAAALKADAKSPDAAPVVDAAVVGEVKAGKKGASKLHLTSEDPTKMTPEQRRAEAAEFKLAKRDATLEAEAKAKATGKARVKMTKTEQGGQIAQLFERAREEGRIVPIKIRGKNVRLRISRTGTRVVGAAPKDVSLEAGRTALREQGIDYETMELPTTQSELQAVETAARQAAKARTASPRAASSAPAKQGTLTGSFETGGFQAANPAPPKAAKGKPVAPKPAAAKAAAKGKRVAPKPAAAKAAAKGKLAAAKSATAKAKAAGTKPPAAKSQSGAAQGAAAGEKTAPEPQPAKGAATSTEAPKPVSTAKEAPPAEQKAGVEPLRESEVPKAGEGGVPESPTGGGRLGKVMGEGPAIAFIGAGIAESVLRQKAIEKEVEEKGYVPVGPQAFMDLPWYEKLARAFTDPMLESQADPLSRLNVKVFRQRKREEVAKLPPGATTVTALVNVVWREKRDPHDLLPPLQEVDDVLVTYNRQEDGTWKPRVPEGGRVDERGVVRFGQGNLPVPDLNKILDEKVSDAEVMEALSPGYRHERMMDERVKEMLEWRPDLSPRDAREIIEGA